MTVHAQLAQLNATAQGHAAAATTALQCCDYGTAAEQFQLGMETVTAAYMLHCNEDAKARHNAAAAHLAKEWGHK